MRENIHPNYVETTVSCACGSSFKTRSTRPVIKLDICSSCHPFFTGRQKFVDTAGRVERFQKRFAKVAEAPVKKTPAKVAKGQASFNAAKKVKILSSAPVKAKKPAAGPSKQEKAMAKGAAKPAAPAKA